MNTTTLSVKNKSAYTMSSARKYSMIGRALDHNFRRDIIDTILSNGNYICVTDIYIELRKEQSEVSQMLAVLYKAKIVYYEKIGKKYFYSVDIKKLDFIKRTSRRL